MRNTLDEILKIRSLEVYDFYIAHLYQEKRVIPNENITNPFLYPHIQKNPSFEVYKGYDGSYFFTDVETGDIGDCINFVQKMERVSRMIAMVIIDDCILVPISQNLKSEYLYEQF
ncbi:hypothetical protein [Cyclobacterium sp. SYSU L10401]|uniref:hypothetical protein n=1 Tax=Cyclobacterium sp. SYSU L10401 TaxID=2678657 RepID=UPI0013D85E89|nr:hypothetical protein [Cyclobacterium sp. SYSU L10401]